MLTRVTATLETAGFEELLAFFLHRNRLLLNCVPAGLMRASHSHPATVSSFYSSAPVKAAAMGKGDPPSLQHRADRR